ncbi:unnamed protein product [Rhizophagus irregularis]|nr:unnamed protein product [Rhizophagus irregularis]
MTHWVPDVTNVSDSPVISACLGCSLNDLHFSAMPSLRSRCPTERCIMRVPLSSTILYPTKKNYKFRRTTSITLSTSLNYARSLLFYHLYRRPTSFIADPISPLKLNDVTLPASTTKLYTDGSFYPTSRTSPSTMSYAWSALDDDDHLLESFSDSIPPVYPSALRSDLIAVLSGLTSLEHGSVVTILSDCAQLITLWNKYVSCPFSLHLLKEPNHLIWLSIRNLLLNR